MDASLIAVGGDTSFYLGMLARYRRDPHSVPADWALFFHEDEAAACPAGEDWFSRAVEETQTAFRTWGHLSAQLDPLARRNEAFAPEIASCIERIERQRVQEPEGQTGGTWLRLDAAIATMTLAYAGTATLEAAHITDRTQREWIQSAYEASIAAPTQPGRQQDILETLTKASELEAFLRKRFPGKKRFGLEGGEAFLVLVEGIVNAASESRVDELVIGGMHRGRLNMLVNVMQKPPAEIFAEVKGRDLFADGPGRLGDVPYHLGYSCDRAIGDRHIRLSLLPHPSHLSAVSAVAVGKARAKRDARPSHDTMALLLHTDAAFSGQGLICELLQLGGVAGFSVRGAVHCILNNQLGFTTNTADGRTSRYCTDVGKMIEAPIFHVNAEDAEAVAKIAALAVEWRQRFGKDVLIDLVCYRRNGHNELDEPRFTQPVEYAAIDVKVPVAVSYQRHVADGERKASEIASDFNARLEEGYEQITTYRPNRSRWLTGLWGEISYAGEEEMLRPVESGVAAARLRALGRSICTAPPKLQTHPKVAAFLKSRGDSIDSGENINWATAEALAIASLVADGHSVRMSGQDVVRGTFTQRHLALHDAKSGKAHLVHDSVSDGEARFEPINSPLSEFGVLSYEYGHSLVDPRRLTIWEAQFGDFANGAQIAIDQFIVAGEAKWMRMSGLVLLLPHGLEGQGPEHSSARVERILQQCAGGNIFLLNCSTPANYFHALRRQIMAPYRKPLFIASPKSLFRNRACVSTIDEMDVGHHFEAVLQDLLALQHSATIDRVILCSGKVAYDLEKMRGELRLESSVAIIRLEQLYPFPMDDMLTMCRGFSNARLIWCQEEPANQGAWSYVHDRLRSKIGAEIELISRPAIPAPAGGAIERHEEEQLDLVRGALVADFPQTTTSVP